MYRSAPHLREFHRRMSAAAAAFTDSYEIVFVNDGSPDESLAEAQALHEADPRVRIVDLSRNFGHHKAMMTGLRFARGRLTFLIDCDLEEEPGLLQSFAAEMERTGADVVYGVQELRKGGLAERVSGALFYRLFNALSAYPVPSNLITVRLMTRRYVRALVRHRERELMIGGLWAITGYSQVALPVRKGHKGATTYDLARKIAATVNSITSFSDRPLVYIFYLGMAISALAAIATVYMMVRRLFFDVLLQGWPSLIVSVWLLGGLTLMCLGVIGIYLSKVFMETKRRPYTIVRAVYEHGRPPRGRRAQRGDEIVSEREGAR